MRYNADAEFKPSVASATSPQFASLAQLLSLARVLSKGTAGPKSMTGVVVPELFTYTCPCPVFDRFFFYGARCTVRDNSNGGSKPKSQSLHIRHATIPDANHLSPSIHPMHHALSRKITADRKRERERQREVQSLPKETE